MAPSPNSLTMYDHDQSAVHGSQSSCTSEDPASPNLDFDLKPQFECNDDSLFKLDLESLNATFGNMVGGATFGNMAGGGGEETMFKMEDVFQEEKSHDIAQGPTLAALNFENSVVAMPGFMEDSESGFASSAQAQQQQQPAPVLPPYTTAKQRPSVQQTLDSRPQWNTSLLTAFLARPALRAFSSQTSHPTHTVSSPTTSTPQLIKNENSDRNGFEVTGRFSLVLSGTSQTAQAPEARTTAVDANTVAENKSALADLLTATPMAVGGVAVPMQIKTEAYLDQACQQGSTLTLLTPVRRAAKRSVSPDNASNASVDRKWEEIKQFIHDDEAPTFPTTASEEPLLNQVKSEPEGNYNEQ